MGIPPMPNTMLSLRSATAHDLHRTIARVREALKGMIAFLATRFRIYSAEFIPYEGQLLVLVKIFADDSRPGEAVMDAASRWFWSITLSEALRGKPDHYVARAITAAERLASGDLEALSHRLTATGADFIERRFIRGTALSAGFASMHAVNGARSLVTGEVINPEYYMSEFNAENFEAFLPLEIIRKLLGAQTLSSKILANTIVVTESDRQVVRRLNPLQLIERLFDVLGDEAAVDVMNSQFIPPNTRELLQHEYFEDVLGERASRLEKQAEKLAK